MKQGRELNDLAAEIMRQHKAKNDYVANTNAITMHADTLGEPRIVLKDWNTLFGINNIAHGQIAEQAKIPKSYYDRMRAEAPHLLANNVNEWFTKYPTPRMLRTLDNRARALLSTAYRPLDNYDFASAILPVLADRKLTVMSCEITEKRLYLKAVDEQLYRDVPVGHKMGDGSHTIFSTCAPVVIASNSEVGFGRLTIDTGVYDRGCTNMALWSDGGLKRTHVGARHKLLEDVENIDAYLSEKTKAKTDEALWLQVRDVLAAAFNPEFIAARGEKITAASKNRIEGKVDKVVEVFAAKNMLNATEQESIFKHLIEGGSLSQYGLHAAVTRAAQDVASYDRATELEYLGGRVIELPKNEWDQLAQAA
jgi:hypothetical protein